MTDQVSPRSDGPMLDGVRAYAAGAGTGKTYRICEDITNAVTRSDTAVDPTKIIAATFTKAAAAELEARIQERILAEDTLPWDERIRLVEGMELAAIGTVHSVARQLLDRYALRLGLSPRLRVLDAESAGRHLAQAQARMPPEPWERLAEAAEPLCLDEPRTLARHLLAEKRSNRISKERFLEQMSASAERLCQLLSPDGPDSDAPDPTELSGLAQRALEMIAVTDDDTKKTAKAVEKLQALSHIRSPAWKDIVEAGKLSAGKRSGANDCLDELRHFSSAVRRMPGLHDHLRAFTKLLTRQTLALEHAYRDYKRQRGLLDFVDLEVLLLTALERDDIRQDLSDSFDLLFVDEFQDSSPIQLAIFLRLHECVGESVWVGDEKQSIYGFRDADIELIRAAWRLLDEERVKPLGVSYRAHAGLVDVLNGIFEPVFGENARLEADREALDAPAFERWFLAVSKREEERQALAAGLRELGDEGVPLGDIAVLVRTNRGAQDLAAVLEKAGVPAVVERPGLLGTRECELARAGLALVADSWDGLAAATILHLLGDATEETPAWLSPRLRAMGGGQETPAAPPWADDPLLVGIRRIDGRLHSPSEVLITVIQRLDLPDRLARWGDSARRAANLDALVTMAFRYEDEMLEAGRGVSLRGLHSWLQQRSSEEQDYLPLPFGIDAVTVSTCHSAKGLEWPVVVLAELGKRFEPDMWAPNTDGGRVEEGRPLADRNLRNWIWPFGKGGWMGQQRVSGSGLNDDAIASEEGAREVSREEDEARRLLYVAMTRARERLILAHRGTPAAGPSQTAWLDLVPHRDVVDTTLGDGLHQLEGMRTTVRVRVIHDTDMEMGTGRPTASRRVVEPKIEGGPYPLRFRSPSGMDAVEPSNAPDAVPGREMTRGVRGVAAEILRTWDVPGTVRPDDWTALGSAVHAYLAGLPSLESVQSEERVAVARRVLKGYAVEDALEPEQLASLGEQFRQWVVERYPNARWFTEVPVVAPRKEGGQWRGTIDLLLVWEDGRSVIIDHKIAPLPASRLEEKAATYAGQLAAYRSSVMEQGLIVEETCVHLVLGGGVVVVE